MQPRLPKTQIHKVPKNGKLSSKGQNKRLPKTQTLGSLPYSKFLQTGGAGVSKDALRNKRRVVKLVTIVTVMFALSWLPIQVVLTMIMIVVKDVRGVPK